MNLEMMSTRLTPQWPDASAVMAAYERHNEEVRRDVPGDRLIDSRPGQGWVADMRHAGARGPFGPFPHEDSASDFQARVGIPTDS